MVVTKSSFRVFCVLVVFIVCGCGTASNNDQGASFTNEGFFRKSGSDDDSLSLASGAVFELYKDDVAQHAAPNQLLVYMSVGNKLLKQYIHVKRFDCFYDIPGSDPSLRIPTDSWAVSAYLPHASYDEVDIEPDDAEGGGSVPSPSSTTAMEFPILSPNFVQFLNANRNLLPQMPFGVIANCYAVGLTQAGDTIQTDTASLSVQVFETAECCGGDENFRGEAGTGGDLPSSDTEELE